MQSVHRVANRGDTVMDLQAGWNAAVRWNIGVLSGAHTKEQLEKAPHTHLIPSVATLPVLWKTASFHPEFSIHECRKYFKIVFPHDSFSNR